MIVYFLINDSVIDENINNEDYAFVTYYNGYWYLDLNSIRINECNPPHYEISGVFLFRTESNKSQYHSETIKYNLETKDTYYYDNGVLKKDDTEGSFTYQIMNRRFANSLFKAALGINFYDNRHFRKEERKIEENSYIFICEKI